MTLEDQVDAEKARALQEPGPGWRQWFLQNALRWYYALGVLIVDIQIIVFWFELGSVVGLGLSLAGALYLEFLLYRYLWYRPHPEAMRYKAFRRTWFRPTEYGRWTPEADLVRTGISLPSPDEGPNPKEFL